MDKPIDIGKVKDAVARAIACSYAQVACPFGSYTSVDDGLTSNVDVLIVGGPDFISENIFAVTHDIGREFGCRFDACELRNLERAARSGAR